MTIHRLAPAPPSLHRLHPGPPLQAFDDAQTKDQLSVFGSATLVTSRTKPFAFNSTGYYLQN